MKKTINSVVRCFMQNLFRYLLFHGGAENSFSFIVSCNSLNSIFSEYFLMFVKYPGCDASDTAEGYFLFYFPGLLTILMISCYNNRIRGLFPQNFYD